LAAAIWRFSAKAHDRRESATDHPREGKASRRWPRARRPRRLASAVIKSLIIDNYDSFTFNLYQLLGQVNGEAPLVVTNDALDWPRLRRLGFDNLVISPGPGRPDRRKDFGVCAEAILRAAVPVLGVCLGHQGIAALHGAQLEYAPEPMHGRISRIYHTGEDILEGITSPFSAVRYNSLILGGDLPECLEKIAWTDGGLAMAIRHRERPIWGVQFHPESICTEHGFRILANFKAITERLISPRTKGAVCYRTPKALLQTRRRDQADANVKSVLLFECVSLRASPPRRRLLSSCLALRRQPSGWTAV
jgi:anthranilate synthase/aminodeoxychorismate synthase-like glutamine amidotransferase